MWLQHVDHNFESLAKLYPCRLCPHSSICAYSDHTTLTVPGKTKIIIIFVRDAYGRYNADPVQQHVMCKRMIPVHIIQIQSKRHTTIACSNTEIPFCKPYEDWNAENYRRYVKRGSTGIALFVMNRDKPYLRYVFDVADTGVRRSSPELKPWEVTPENRSYVMEAMERTFGVAADGVLEAQLEDIASALAAEYWDDYKKQFLDIVANSFLEEYDELNIEVA